MQDIHAIGGGGDSRRFFGGGGDRRLRPHNHQAAALKCPRCDSHNTKFCYYNNYNLSQPRHYCKGCRRYWTIGGVLRNVPVGGGCRKTKRSKTKSDAARESESKDQSSSSESTSSLSAATTAAAPKSAAADVAVTKEGSAPSNTTSDTSVVYNFPDLRLYNLINPQPFDQQSTNGQIFTTELGSFTNLMTSSENMMGFEIGNMTTTSFQGPEKQGSGPGPIPAVNEFKMKEITGGISNEGLVKELDWGDGGGGGGGGQELFDLTAAVWSQTQWPDNDQSLNYLL